MAKTINKSTGKRTYKHSDAWIKAHEEKLAKKQEAQKKPGKRGRPKKTDSEKTVIDSKCQKNNAKCIAKNANVKKMAKKVKRAIDDATKKQAKKPMKKLDVKKINSLLGDARKKAMSLKKTMKEMSKMISAILMDAADVKTHDKLVKKLAFFGFDLNENKLVNIPFSVKVKLPKVKLAKKDIEHIEAEIVDLQQPVAKSRKTDDAIDIESIDSHFAKSLPVVDLSEDDQDNAINEDYDEEDYDDDDPEMNDLDDDDKELLREQRRIEREYERDCRGETDDTIGDAMRENGDWD